MGLLCFGSQMQRVLRDTDTSRLRAGVASFLVHLPIVGSVLRLMGAITASRSTLERHFQAGDSVVLVPGGIASVFFSDEENEQIYVEKRKGFCRLALQQGTPLVPVYAFGATQLLTVVPKSHDGFWARMSRKYRLALMFFYGTFYLPIPRPRKLVCVTGKPIAVAKDLNPSAKAVNALHARFVDELRALYQRHQATVAGYENKPLTIR